MQPIWRFSTKFVRTFTLAIVALVLILGIGGKARAEAISPPGGTRLTYAQAQNQCTANRNATIAEHAVTGAVRFIGANDGQVLQDTSAAASPEAAARGYLSACAALFGIADAGRDLNVERERTLKDGRTIVRYQQLYQNVPVLGGEMIVHVNGSKNVTVATGKILPKPGVDTNPSVNADAARANALNQVARLYNLDTAALSATEPRLWVYNPVLIRPGGGFTQLVWRMDVTSPDRLDIRELVLIDAHRGGVALHFNQVDTAKNRETYTMNHSTNEASLPGTLLCNESNPTCSGGDTDAVNAHKYAGETYDFYANTHGRDSIDDNGMTIVSSTHFGTGYQNAFWDGEQMVYGDGFSQADDVVGHELTHGVTQYESNLFYYYQSGAINESLSDVWGEFIDLSNSSGTDTAGVRWQMGEDVPGFGAIRSMKDPTLFGDPDKMTSANYFTGKCNDFNSSCDNGGVHTNSGVNNKATYLMTDGGSFNGKTVSGLGISKVAKIYYQVQTTLLTSGSDYADLYNALYQACQNLIGGGVTTAGDCTQVRNATDAVEMNLQPVADYNVDALICPSGYPVNVFRDDLELGAGKWLTAGLVGATHWTLNFDFFPFPHSGSNFLYGDDFSTSGSDSVVYLKTAVKVPANGYLHFFHAYGFEDPNYDGGILEYSTNNGASWSNAGGLIQVNGYDGTLAGSNPLGAVSAFLSDSHGYISTRVNLASLAGQKVKFRWRLGVDSIIFDRGWFLDDVRIYSCTPNAADAVGVSRVLTTDKNGIIKTKFKRGEKIQYWADMLNESSSSCNVATSYKSAMGSTTLHAFNGNISLNPGEVWYYLNRKIPKNAALGKYKLTVITNCGGFKNTVTSKFKIVAGTALANEGGESNAGLVRRDQPPARKVTSEIKQAK